MDTVAFEGDRQALDLYLRSIEGYYVYVLCRPDGTPFYVGKGIKRRALEHELEALRNHPIGETNPIKCNVIRKLHRNGQSILYRIDSIHGAECEGDCYEREAALILKHRRLHEGGILTNLAGGLGNFTGAAPVSLEKHAATLSGEPIGNPERAVLNRFLTSIGPVDSVPIKPIEQLSRILPSTPHPSPRRPTARSAYALIASASANGLSLADGVVIPRWFQYQNVNAIIENGVSRDILKSGMASIVTAEKAVDERFRLSTNQISMIGGLVGRKLLADQGLV